MSDKKEINKPPINIDKWLITKTHLKKVISLLEKRFPENTSNIDIEIKINDETDHPKSFGELDTIVNEEIIENKKILNALTIRATYFYRESLQKHAWLYVNFNTFFPASFHISCIGIKNRDWADGFENEVKALFNSFKPNEKAIEYVRKQEKDRFKYSDSVVYLDYNNQVIKEMEKEQRTTIIKDNQFHFGNGDNVKGNKTSNNERNESFGYKFIRHVIIPLAVAVVSGIILQKILGFL